MNTAIQDIDPKTGRQIKLQYQPVSPYKHLRCAYLTTNSMTHVFDTMRYERAFLVRVSDVEKLLDFAAKPQPRLGTSCRLMLCRYNFAQRHDWSHGRLMSGQQLTELSKSMLVEDWVTNGNYTLPESPKKALKIRADAELTGDFSFILQMMLLNRAVPCSETDAHAIERLFFTGEMGEEISVSLTNFLSKESEWKLPKV